jgi:hypothetical protein
MPFRTFRKEITPGKPVHLYTAVAGDVGVEVRATSLSDDNLSVGFSFRLGGSEDMNADGALVCSSGEWSSDVEEGDEIWVEVYPAAFTLVTPITVMVRSVKTGGRSKDDWPQQKA